MNLKASLSIFFFIIIVPQFCFAGKFSWIESSSLNQHVDLLWEDQKIARYVFEKMNPKDRERTYKPFHHIFQSNGTDFLTKGPGGKYTHHRGIYFGFSKCSAMDGSGKSVNVDTWHCKRAYQTHEKFINKTATKQKASHTAEISWRVDDGTVFATEHRTLEFSFIKEGSLQIDFQSNLSTNQKKVQLDGDAQHAGFQFRASNEVAAKTSKETYYIRPNEGIDAKGKTKNWPQDKEMTNLLWEAQSVVVGGDRYTTLYLNHPGNPKPSFHSERDYGRFGSYFKAEITPSNPLVVHYRLHIIQGEMSPKECEELSQAFIKSH